MKRAIVGMETSGKIRGKLRDLGIDAWSVDILPSEDNSPYHIQGDVFDVLKEDKVVWDLGIFHPTCTYLTCSAAWAYKEPDYDRYPTVGYHQKVKPETLTGKLRTEARAKACEDFLKCFTSSGVKNVAVENPVGILSSWFRKPDQVIQPYWFGEDASKATCLWLRGLPNLVRTERVIGRLILDKRTGKYVERWSNQTDSGQNRLGPSKDRWSLRSKTYEGVAAAMADQWGRFILSN